MELKVNGALIPSPKEFKVTVLDIDNGETTVRTSDGTLNRDRVAVKRQVDLAWGILTWLEASIILQAISGVYFELYYPDPMAGAYITKTFYVGNRPSPVAFSKDGNIFWNDFSMTLTER